MGFGANLEFPWESQPQDPADPAPEFFSATTLARHNFTNSGTTIGAKKSGIVQTSDGSSTYLSRSVAIRAGQPLFLAIYFRRNATATVGNTYYGLSENAAAGSFLSLTAGTSAADGISFNYRATAGGALFQIGSNSSVISADTDYCVVGVAPSYTSSQAYIYVNGVKYNSTLAAGTPSGTALYAFESIAALRRNTVAGYTPIDTYAVGYGGAISEARAKFISENPWAMFAPQERRIWIPSAGGTTYTITPSGGITLSGSGGELHGKIIDISGGTTLGGTGSITFTSGGTTYTITPSGGLVLGGEGTQLKGMVIIPSGGITFAGTADTVDGKVWAPSGGVSFGGTGSMSSNTSPIVDIIGERTKVGAGT
jgi:hypothetical protein